MQPKEITREQATKILEEQRNMPHARVTACFNGKWWDIRGVSDEELDKFVKGILGDSGQDVNKEWYRIFHA